MERHREYVARKRARFVSNGKRVNIPYGTTLATADDWLVWNGAPLCRTTSQNAYDYFSQNDDGKGLERGGLVAAIMACLEKRDGNYQARWNKVWDDPMCQRYKRTEHPDYWIWNYDFYNAPTEDLRHIAALVGAKM